MSSGLFGDGRVSMLPGRALVVERPVSETAVEDANEAVAERSEGLVVQIASGATFVVERAAAFAVSQGAERPLVDRVVEPFVANVTGEHGTLLARRDRER